MTEPWFWAAKSDAPALDRFVIESSTERFWQRVRSEISPDETCAWGPVHKGRTEPETDDILDMMFTVVPLYRVNQNRFVFEAAKIPAFARFIRNARFDLPNYVSNSAFPDAVVPVEPYSDANSRRLASIVANTLDIDPDWW